MSTRRRFIQLVTTAAAAGLVERTALGALVPAERRRLSDMARRTASAEGAWVLTRVEGRIPRELLGTLYRVCPGQGENHGVRLRHLFDGDAFVAAYGFADGRARLTARFVETPQRVEELRAGRMLYGEFGTPPPARPRGWTPKAPKNQPSVNVVRWDGQLLGLSEGGHPTALDPSDLSYRGEWDFRRTLPRDVTFTAHPRFDPETGEGFAYGIRRGEALALVVFRMARDGRLVRLHEVPLDGYAIVHDMLLTSAHLVFVVPPARFDLSRILTGEAKTIAEAVRFLENEPTRILVVRRDGTGGPVTVDLPPEMCFHHGNAVERDGRIAFETILSPGGAALEAVYAAAGDRAPVAVEPHLTRLEIDLRSRALISRSELDDLPVEFPRFDPRRVGRRSRYLYALGFADRTDPLAGTRLVRYDLEARRETSVDAGAGRLFGEPVFVPGRGAGEADGWVLAQGYDASRDENFLEVRDAGSLDLAARVWTGIRFPLGFHGSFSSTTEE